MALRMFAPQTMMMILLSFSISASDVRSVAQGWLIGAVCKDLRSNCAQAITLIFSLTNTRHHPACTDGEVPEYSNTLYWRVAQQLPHIIFELSVSTPLFLFDLHVIFFATTSQKKTTF